MNSLRMLTECLSKLIVRMAIVGIEVKSGVLATRKRYDSIKDSDPKEPFNQKKKEACNTESFQPCFAL